MVLKIGKYLIERGESVEIWSDKVDLSSTHSLAKEHSLFNREIVY
jgi:hypothetical protein